MSFLQYLPLVASFAKNWLKNKEHDKQIRDHDQTTEKLSTIENLIVRLEKKLKETDFEIDDLKRQVLLSRTINIILFVLLITISLLTYLK